MSGDSGRLVLLRMAYRIPQDINELISKLIGTGSYGFWPVFADKVNEISLNKIFDFIHLQSKSNYVIQTTTFFNDEPLYSVLFLHDDRTSCYLYGAGNIDIKNRYAGSLALWNAIKQASHKKLKRIDLEGINSPFRGEYKLCFGGNIENYYRVITP